MIHITIPKPPSVNGLFANVPGKGRVRSDRYRQWAVSAGWDLKAQRPRPIAGPVDIRLTIGPPRKGSDIDNRIKAVIDLLVTHELIEGDGWPVVRSVFGGVVRGRQGLRRGRVPRGRGARGGAEQIPACRRMIETGAKTMTDTMTNEVADLKAKIEDLKSALDEKDDEIDELEKRIDNVESEKDDLESRVDDLNVEVVEYLVRADRMLCEKRYGEAMQEIRDGLLAFKQSPWPFGYDLHHPGQDALL